MESSPFEDHRRQLLDRRRRLGNLAGAGAGEVDSLLALVDSALARLDAGRYGLCRTCGEPIEEDLLLADPVVELCLDHLTPPQARSLEDDLELAARLQREMLPPQDLGLPGWESAYHYRGAGLVSGDYCDLMSPDRRTLYFMMGDVTGKGHAAAMLMSHLHAAFGSLLGPGADLPEVLARANRIFCESSLATHFATLFCGRIDPDGTIDYCLAGHPPPMLLRGGTIGRLEAEGLPLGMLCQQSYAPGRLQSDPGDLLLLFSDGVTEAQDPAGGLYGEERLAAVLAARPGAGPQDVVDAVLRDLATFRDGAPVSDDVTVMALRRTA